MTQIPIQTPKTFIKYYAFKSTCKIIKLCKNKFCKYTMRVLFNERKEKKNSAMMINTKVVYASLIEKNFRTLNLL